MKKIRGISGSELYSPTDDTESNVYSLACVMFACGMDGGTAESVDIDEVIVSMREHYDSNTTMNPGPEKCPSASAMALGRTRWLILKRLRLSYWDMKLSTEIAANG